MPTLMIQGTTSDAGKSTLVAALCRCLHRRGHSVAPFKPQNMSLNSAVTPEGGEIGRAQALQAYACGIEPHTDMNPVLLKPNTDIGAQVIVHGKAIENMDAGSYHRYKVVAMDAVLESHKRLQKSYQYVLVEGAGSPAEINLRQGDVANMGFAERVDCPVIIIADIDKGGVFAHLVGTLELLSQSEQERVAGFVINRFRGDIKLLENGLEWLEARTGKPVLGVLPYLHGLTLDAEDALPDNNETTPDKFNVVVPVLPRISNHTDFDPLRAHPDVNFTYVKPDSPIPPADLIILPGSKCVREDLAFLKQQGWDKALHKHVRYGGKVLGICGGFQMLGQVIRDPAGIESEAGNSQGFSFLDVATTLTSTKELKQVSGHLSGYNVPVKGYEIHAGRTKGPDLLRPFILGESGEGDGSLSEDGLVAGTYWHGLFDTPKALNSILHWAGLEKSEPVNYEALREASINRLADAVEQSLDLDAIMNLLEDDTCAT